MEIKTRTRFISVRLLRKPIISTVLTLQILSLSAQETSKANIQAKFDSIFKYADTSVNCSDQIKVSAEGFNQIVKRFLTKQTPNVLGELKQGTAASLNINSDKTSAEIQATFLAGTRFLINAGFNGTINNNITELYSGKDGIANDWGIKAGLSFRLNSSLKYESEDECNAFHLNRTAYILGLYNQLKPILSTNVAQIDAEIEKETKKLKDFIHKNAFDDHNAEQSAKLRERLKSLYAQREKAISLLGENNNDEAIINSINDLVIDSVAAFESRTAEWTGYTIHLLNLGLFYNNKSFTQFFPNQPSYLNRFVDTAYNNFGASLGWAMYFVGPRFQSNLIIDAGFRNTSNFELQKNKKYLKTYSTEVRTPFADSTASQFELVSKKAFDSTNIQFNTFNRFDISGQFAAFFGEEKNVGINVASTLTFSPGKSNLDIAFGPMVSLPNSEKGSSRLNFGLMAGYRDILNGSLTTKDKFFISFNVAVPFKIIQ